jgi:gliding motility-associated-like protein
MKFFTTSLFTFFLVLGMFSQNLQVNTTTYTPQELIEDILINSGCIENIVITNVVSGAFNDGDKSFGYFSENSGTFPFQNGIVMSTGKLNNVPGPNTSLSDDNAPAWNGDIDLESALGISNTTNATILEFDFVPNADNIRFRYIFASEEYQENNANTCIYSDAFAFLIKPIGGTYTNIAVVPNTNIPVQVTTVHSGIPGACPPTNETYFDGWNNANVPINFNGQTAILTAETTVIPNQVYHIKLVIADEENYRYDSAVFLEAESFNISANLGPDQSFANNNPLCASETFLLDATPLGTNPLGYTWFKDNVIILGETNAQYTVTEMGIYKVAIDYGSGCIAIDEVVVEYADFVQANNTDLYQCTPNTNGIAVFNLFEASQAVTNGDSALQIQNFYTSFFNAENNIAPIESPNSYTNTLPNEIVFAKVISPVSCFAIAQVRLRTSNNITSPYDLVGCSTSPEAATANFNLNDVTTQILNDFDNPDLEVSYHINLASALTNSYTLPTNYTNTQNGFQIIYARISGTLGCEAIAPIHLTVIPVPQFRTPTQFYYCLNTSPETLTIDSGVVGNTSNMTFLWSTGATTSTIEVQEPGTFQVAVTRNRNLNGIVFSCTATNMVTVLSSEVATIDYELSGDYNNQTITIIATGTGDYEYALDNGIGPYQDSPVFENIIGGIHTVYVKDKNGCGIAKKLVYVLNFPKYFTPNNDGYHDTWIVTGQNFENLQLNRIEIYNRYSKLLYIIKAGSGGWDGTYNGKHLPSSDYWYTAVFKNGDFYKSHFALKR